MSCSLQWTLHIQLIRLQSNHVDESDWSVQWSYLASWLSTVVLSSRLLKVLWMSGKWPHPRDRGLLQIRFSSRVPAISNSKPPANQHILDAVYRSNEFKLSVFASGRSTIKGRLAWPWAKDDALYEIEAFWRFAFCPRPYLRYVFPRLSRKYENSWGFESGRRLFFFMHSRHGKVTSGKELCTVPARSRAMARPISSNSHW